MHDRRIDSDRLEEGQRRRAAFISTALVTFVAACGSASQAPGFAVNPSVPSIPSISSAPATIAGTYKCARGSDDPDTVVGAADGTFTVTHPDGVTEGPGTWTLDGTSGAFGEEQFTLQDGKIVFGDETVCTKQ